MPYPCISVKKCMEKNHGFLQIFLTFHLGLGSHEKKELEQSPTEARRSKKLSHMLFSRIIGEWDFFLMPIVTPCHAHTMNVGDVDLHDWLLSRYVDTIYELKQTFFICLDGINMWCVFESLAYISSNHKITYIQLFDLNFSVGPQLLFCQNISKWILCESLS